MNTEILIATLVKLAKVCEDCGEIKLADKADKLLLRLAQTATAPYGLDSTNPSQNVSMQQPTATETQINQQMQTIIQAIGQLKSQMDQTNTQIQQQIQELTQNTHATTGTTPTAPTDASIVSEGIANNVS